jgi:hypothetical protein
MSIKSIIARIVSARNALIANRPEEALRIAFDQIALIKLRIQTKGLNSDEKPFAPYDPRYAKERRGKGYQVNIVDFTRTGRMWANIVPRLESNTRNAATVIIEGGTQDTRDKVAGQFRKRGNILKPSKGELALLQKANRERVLRYLGF